MARQTRVQRRHKYQSLKQGANKHLTGNDPVTVGGKEFTPKEIAGNLQSLLDAMDATSAGYATYRSLVAKQEQLEAKLRDFVRLLGSLMYLRFGFTGRELADFGIPPLKKTGPKTTAAKLEMVQQAKATRTVRGTMGKRQKRKIKGKP